MCAKCLGCCRVMCKSWRRTEFQSPVSATWILLFLRFCFYSPRSWAQRALAIVNAIAFWKEMLRGIFKVWFSLSHEIEAIKNGMEVVLVFGFNWFLSKEVKKEGNLNSCWKESSVIYFCNSNFPRFGQYLYISLLSCIFGTKILVVVCIIVCYTSCLQESWSYSYFKKMQLILKHYANLKKSLQDVEKSKLLFTPEGYIKRLGESQIKNKSFSIPLRLN